MNHPVVLFNVARRRGGAAAAASSKRGGRRTIRIPVQQQQQMRHRRRHNHHNHQNPLMVQQQQQHGHNQAQQKIRRRMSSISSSSRSATTRRLVRTAQSRQQQHLRRFTTALSANNTFSSRLKQYVNVVKQRPIEYATIPCVAAFVGIMTNWMGVKMLFYPIHYVGYNIVERDPNSPYGYIGWQGVVPTKTETMAKRLVNIITERLLSLQEAFARLQPNELSALLMPAISESILEECGSTWHSVLKPILPTLMPLLLRRLQNDIDSVLDLQKVVLDAFVRDKVVLVDLFQKVGRVELDFLVNSGFGFGFMLGLGQMIAWVAKPMSWTLPVAGALVGYVTNWIAIKLLFEPAEPVEILPQLNYKNGSDAGIGILTIQGLFESRQIEVSDEFGAFMERRVLNSASLLKELARDGSGNGYTGNDDGNNNDLYSFLRRQLPYPIPASIITAAVKAINKVADNPSKYPEVHEYVQRELDISNTLSTRLKKLSPTDFEDLLHPVFQEDEMTLIVTGGVLGAIAGLMQTKLGWGGPKAMRRSVVTIISTLAMSAGFYLHQKYEELEDDKNPPVSAKSRPKLRKRVSIVRMPILEEEDIDWFGDNHRDH